MPTIGIDIISIDRFKKHDRATLYRIAEFFLHPSEIKTASGSADIYQHLASRFAVKEAIIKAIPETMNYLDIVIAKPDGIRPEAILLPSHLKKYSLSISLAHCQNSAIGMAFATSNNILI